MSVLSKWVILGKRGVLGWAPPEAQPESRVPGQVVYLGDGIPLGFPPGVLGL